MYRRVCTRSATAVVGLLLLTGGLTACSDEQSAAQEAAQTYVDLIATGQAEDLDALAEMTVSGQPDEVEAAGPMLAGATERIEVLQVGEVHDAADGSIVNIPVEAGVDTGSGVAATVRYRLDGTEHSSDIVLAPYADTDRGEVDAWTVVRPLMGELLLDPAAGGTTVVLDQYIAGVPVAFPAPNSRFPAPLYPGGYELTRRADPYLTSAPEPVTIVAGERVEPSSVLVEGTDEVVPFVAEELTARLEACPDPQCPDALGPVLSGYGVDDIWSGDYDLEVTAAPAVQLNDRTYEFTDGELRLDLRDAPESPIRISVHGSGDWRIDHSSGEPFLATVYEVLEPSG